MTELEQKMEQATIERNKRTPLLMIENNRKEIREISMAAQDYMVELNPDIVRIKIWEAIPRIVIEFFQAALDNLSKSDAMGAGESTIIVGDIMEVGIDGLLTKDGDKDGNITPLIKCRSEFKYENVTLPYHDEITIDEANDLKEERAEGLPAQFFNNREQIKDISVAASKVLASQYGIIMSQDHVDWFLIPLTVLAFFRKTRDFLVEHKDDGELGVEIDFANILTLGITKEGGIDDDDPVDYYLFITPGQYYKKEKAKDDGTTEQ